MEETCMEASSPVGRAGWKQRDALLTGKRDEALLELKANKSTFHTCICCVSLQQAWTRSHARRHSTGRETKAGALPEATYMIP